MPLAGCAGVDFIGRSDNDTMEGGAFDDRFVGSGAAEIFVGGLGNDTLGGVFVNEGDTLVGASEADALRGGAGDDVLVVSDTSFVRVDGGAGFDTLRLQGGMFFALGSFGTKVREIEAIDLSQGVSQIDVTAESIRALSSTGNWLFVTGGIDNAIQAFGFTDNGSVTLSSGTFHSYTKDGAELLVNPDAQVYLIS